MENTTHAPKSQWWKTARAKTAAKIAVALIVVGTVVWYFFFHPYVTTDDARISMTLIKLAPSGVSGRIEKVNVVEGSEVKAGDILIEIDHRLPQAQYDRTKARADQATRERVRLEHLVQDGSATTQSLDSARSVELTAKAEEKQSEVALENTTLRSPVNGFIVQKSADVGNLLESGQIALVIADTESAWASANIEETSVADVKLGQPVTINIDEGGKIEGKVSQINRAAASQFALIPSDNGSGNYTKVVQRIPIKMELSPEARKGLRAGQSVEVKIKVH